MPKKLSIPNSLHMHVGLSIAFLDNIYTLHRDRETHTYFVNMVVDGKKVEYPLDDGDVIGIFKEDTNVLEEKVLSRYDNNCGFVYEPWTDWISNSLKD
ncbi:hypothetical protein KAR91_78320 [Candidatus Pacearchaeota archaeon]|nr:hypothetical protein [Candidatus Pacearchaeota archaeon]